MLPNIKMVGQRPDFCFYKPDTNLYTRFPARYSEDDWIYQNKKQLANSLVNQRLSERIVQNSRLIIGESLEIESNWRREVNYKLKERMSEVKFLIDELRKQKKNVMMEEEALKTYRDRVETAINFLKGKSLTICQNCFILREGRLGVDLCDDEVDRQLRLEMKVITGCQSLMDRVFREVKEQLRELRAAMYLLDEDLKYKDQAFEIDEKNITLKPTSVDETKADRLQPVRCDFSLAEWEFQTYRNIETNGKQINSAGQLRAYVDLLLKQIEEDLVNQRDRTNEAFARRIEDMKEAKTKLEKRHRDVSDHANYVQDNIDTLEAELATKNRGLALCQTRLENRARRPGMERTCDSAQDSLINERKALFLTMCKFKEKIKDNKTMLRYLLGIQMSLAEDINIKMNSLKIDEVDCGLLRQQLQYPTF